MNFTLLKEAVAKQFATLAQHDLLRSSATKDELWTTYLASFPAGTNPMFKERTEHDCNCCKQFIRAVGDVIAIVNGKLVSIWDITVAEPAYQAVADGMAALVHTKGIQNAFLHYERSAGTEKSFSDTTNGVKTWNHFFVNIPSGKKSGEKNYVRAGADIATELSKVRATHDVFKRGLDELTIDSMDTMLELTAQNSLYRGTEFRAIVSAFRDLKVKYDKVPVAHRDNFVWTNLKTVGGAVSEIRSSMIGSFLVDLSKGVDLEDAVKMYESKAAPTNYKRPTALVTKAMIENARKTIESLGLTSALERRYATLADIKVNNILYANRSTKSAMTGDVFSELANKVSEKPKKLDKIEEIGIEKFLSDILPKADTLEVMLENHHSNNLVSLIAPADPTSGDLLKWNNNFSWTYNGDVTDSIKERVKQAGGSVTGDLCCRLAWSNYDDLDFHMIEPDGYEISFRTRGYLSPAGGKLDVDMNAGGGTTRSPVENIFYSQKSKLKEGVYKLFVHQFNNRDRAHADQGFEVEVDMMGVVHNFVYDQPVRQDAKIAVAEFFYSKKDGLSIKSVLPSTQSVKTMWNVTSQNFRKVNVLMNSPNHWDGNGIGNKHYFFMLEGCKNDGQARGLYNEFLKEELNPHRKVIEMVGAKMKTDESENQLSGIGFSETQRGSVLCRVTGAFTRVVKVVF